MATFLTFHSSPYHLVIYLYLITLIWSTFESRIDSTEIFGPLPVPLASSSTTPSSSGSTSFTSSTSSSTAANDTVFETHHSNGSKLSSSSSSFSLANIFSSLKSYKNLSSILIPPYIYNSPNRHSPSRQETPISSSDYAISHPLISDANARIPLYLYNPGLARKIGLSTLLMTSVIYGLTILPAIYVVTGNLPLPSGLMSSLTGGKRRKRSFYLGTPWELPLFDKPTTEKFLSLLETTLEVRKVNSTTCKRQHLCKVYQWALKSEERPITLSTFERALVNIFGVAAERRDLHLKLIPAVKLYSEAALVALTGSNCTLIYPCTENINYSKASRLF